MCPYPTFDLAGADQLVRTLVAFIFWILSASGWQPTASESNSSSAQIWSMQWGLPAFVQLPLISYRATLFSKPVLFWVGCIHRNHRFQRIRACDQQIAHARIIWQLSRLFPPVSSGAIAILLPIGPIFWICPCCPSSFLAAFLSASWFFWITWPYQLFLLIFWASLLECSSWFWAGVLCFLPPIFAGPLWHSEHFCPQFSQWGSEVFSPSLALIFLL